MEAINRFPELSTELTSRLQRYGNNVFYFKMSNLMTFPTKKDYDGDLDMELIKRSCNQLNNMITKLNKTALVPKIECLVWEDVVKPIMSKILSDKITLVFND